MKIDRLITTICSDHLAKSRDFYTRFFDFEVGYDSDWFVSLLSSDKKLELGIISRVHDMVPAGYRKPPQGFYLTFVVEDVDHLYEMVRKDDTTVVEIPQDTFYGQRRMLLTDPDGTLVDVSSPIRDFDFGSGVDGN